MCRKCNRLQQGNISVDGPRQDWGYAGSDDDDADQIWGELGSVSRSPLTLVAGIWIQTELRLHHGDTEAARRFTEDSWGEQHTHIDFAVLREPPCRLRVSVVSSSS